MSLNDLVVPNPQPASVGLPVRCKHCEHFARTPWYKINGAPTVCSQPAIGRKANDIPCPNFDLDTLPLRKLSRPTRAAVFELARQLRVELGDTRKGNDGLLTLSMILRNLYAMGRAGLRLNEEYSVENSTIVGRLVSYNGTQCTLETKAGTPYTVLVERLRRVQS